MKIKIIQTTGIIKQIVLQFINCWNFAVANDAKLDSISYTDKPNANVNGK